MKSVPKMASPQTNYTEWRAEDSHKWLWCLIHSIVPCAHLSMEEAHLLATKARDVRRGVRKPFPMARDATLGAVEKSLAERQEHVDVCLLLTPSTYYGTTVLG